MADVAYTSWSLIPRDLEPASQEPSIKQPPMMTSIAVDPGGSLVFELRDPPTVLVIRAQVTAMTSEGRGGDFIQVLRGSEGAYQPVEAVWTQGQDGPSAILSTLVGGSGDRLKIHLPSGNSVVFTGIEFGDDG